MRRILFSLVSIGILAGVQAVEAQTPGRPAGPPQPPASGPGEIRGTVVDTESSAPVFGASVAVWSGEPAVLLAGALVRADGSFRIEGLRPGRYELRISSLGYAPRIIGDHEIEAGSPRTSIGTVRLERAAVVLEGVEVTADRSMIELAPDRNAYRARDIAPTAANASEVLGSVPSVNVDAEGKVSLRGNENVAVQINGRPAPLRGAQLAAYLQQIPANVLERVEVIPNPSARYDPDGMAGIINIVLRQNVDLGLSGGFTMSAAATDRYSTSGNLGYQVGRVTLFGNYGYSADERGLHGINDRERYGAGGLPIAITEQDIAGRTSNSGHNLTSSLEYRLNDRDLLFTGFTANARSSGELSSSDYTELTGERLLLDRFDRIRDTDASNRMLDYHAGFKRTFEPQRHELTTELRLNRSADDDRTDLWRQPHAAASGARTEAEINSVEATSRQITGQADYTRMLAARTKLETGYKGNARWLDRDYRAERDPSGSGVFLPSDLSNTFDFDEQVHAVYGVVSQGAGKFELQGGLRAEQASRDFVLGGAESYPFSYGSLFPSGMVMYRLSDAQNVKVSYSRRIRRPGTQELNPFPFFFDSHNVFFGNPELSPEYTDAIELGYQRTGQLGSLQVSPFYRRTSDVIRFIINTADQVDGREVTSVSFRNLDNSSSWGTDVNGSLRLGQRLNGFASFNVFKMVTEGGTDESTLSSDAVTWSARANATAQLNSTLTAQAMYMYRAPMNIERGRFSSMQMSSFSLRQKLPGDKATVSLRLVDPFNTMAMRLEAGDENLLQLTERRFGVRAAHLTFQYTFGSAPRLRQRRPEPAAEPQTGFPQ
jgi:ferric enterobactin receptor